MTHSYLAIIAHRGLKNEKSDQSKSGVVLKSEIECTVKLPRLRIRKHSPRQISCGFKCRI